MPNREASLEGFASRLSELIGEASVSRFAQDVGLGDNLVRQYLKGAVPGLDKVVRICEAKGVNVAWLAQGLGRKERKLDDLGREEIYGAPPKTPGAEGVLHAADGREYVLLPKYDVSVSAGNGTLVRSEQIVDYLAFNSEWFHQNVGIAPGSAALIEVRGDSMTPMLQDGELVIVDTSCDAFKDDAIYVLQYSGALRIKRVRRRLDGKIEVKSANEDYGVELLTEQEAESGNITIVGRARWALSGRRLP